MQHSHILSPSNFPPNWIQNTLHGPSKVQTISNEHSDLSSDFKSRIELGTISGRDCRR